MKLKLPALAAIFAAAASLATAGGHDLTPEQSAVKARNAHMGLYSFNTGVLAGMAKETIPFNAELAQGIAGNLVALSSMNQMAYWPKGTDNASMEGTRALPAIWENIPDVIAKNQMMIDASVALQAAAGDLEGLRGAMGAVGQACGACHKAYRGPR